MRVFVLSLLFLGACSDPVRDHAIERLGGEDPGVPIGPEHRPGQPCVLCHSAGGPASGKPFAVGGTIFTSDAPGARGAADIEVRFVDGRSDAPGPKVRTNGVGNFFVAESDWNVSFPFRVAIFQKNGTFIASMQTTVNRDGSCATCHAPNVAPPFSDVEADRQRSSVGQIYVEAGGAP